MQIQIKCSLFIMENILNILKSGEQNYSEIVV